MSDREAIRRHYATDGIVPRLLAKLRETQGQGVAITVDTLAPLDHYHRGGLASTRHLAEMMEPRPTEQLLDLGCGIGGPARWMAASFGCRVTGIDITPEFCAAARELNALTGMEEYVRILEGDIATPAVGDAVFDKAFSQSALMNVADKAGFCREAFRALKPGGMLVLFMIGTGQTGDLRFPLPFADTSEVSFLSTPEQTRRDLVAAGFDIVDFRDVSDNAVTQQRDYLNRIETEGLPPLGWHVLMGEQRSREMQINAAHAFIEGRLTELEIVARRRPAW